MVMIMLKMNKTPKLFNFLALVATLILSTAVYAMEPEEGKKTPASRLSPIVINEELMKEARRITREKILENLYKFSNKYFATNSYILCYDPLDESKEFSLRVDKVQYERNIFWFNENFLTQPESVSTLNNDILALLKEGKQPIYCGYERAFNGIAEALIAKGITLDSLLDRESIFTDSAETSEEADITTGSLENKPRRQNEKTHRRHRRCNLL